MPKFIEAWNRIQPSEYQKGQELSPEIIQLVSTVYNAVNASKIDPINVKNRLEELLLFLCSPKGRTDTNYRATDLFFCVGEGWHTDEMIQQYIDEQEGEPMIDDSRFQIDEP